MVTVSLNEDLTLPSLWVPSSGIPTLALFLTTSLANKIDVTCLAFIWSSALCPFHSNRTWRILKVRVTLRKASAPSLDESWQAMANSPLAERVPRTGSLDLTSLLRRVFYFLAAQLCIPLVLMLDAESCKAGPRTHEWSPQNTGPAPKPTSWLLPDDDDDLAPSTPLGKFVLTKSVPITRLPVLKLQQIGKGMTIKISGNIKRTPWLQLGFPPMTLGHGYLPRVNENWQKKRKKQKRE